jgi:accessory gene regulator protein AgrB
MCRKTHTGEVNVIDSLANRLARYVVQNDRTADQEVLAYGLGLIISGFVTYTAILTSALLFGLLKEMITAILIYMTMRLTIGGSHANSKILCFITYTGALYACILLSAVLSPTPLVVLVMYIANFIILLLYAPGDTETQPIAKNRLARKLLGILFLTLFYAIYIFARGTWLEASLLLFVPALTCVFLHPLLYKVYRCRKSRS